MDQSPFTSPAEADSLTDSVSGTDWALSTEAAPSSGESWRSGGQTLITVLSFLMTIINGVTLVAIIRTHSIHAKMKLLTGSLTTTDLFLGLSLLLPRLWPLDWISSRHPLCFFRYGLVLLSSYSTCLTLVTMALDRTIAVTVPHFYRHEVSFRRLVAFLAGVWGLVVLLTVISIVGGFPAHMKCSLLTDSNKVVPRHGFYVLGSVTMLSVVLVMALYCSIWITLKKKYAVRAGLMAQTVAPQGQQNSSRKSERNLTVTVFCLAVCFLVGYGPLSFVCLWVATRPDPVIVLPQPLGILLFLCTMLSLLLDPLIYFWRLRDPRAMAGLARAFGCSGTRVAPAAGGSSSSSSSSERPRRLRSLLDSMRGRLPPPSSSSSDRLAPSSGSRGTSVLVIGT